MKELICIDDACREILNYIQSDTFNQSFDEEDRGAVMSGLALAEIIIMARCDKYLMQDGVLKDKEKDDDNKETYQQGLEDAWSVARSFCCDMSYEAAVECFGENAVNDNDVFFSMAPEEALKRSRAYVTKKLKEWLDENKEYEPKTVTNTDKTTNWISVKDKLPERSGMYQVCITVPLDPNDGELYCDPATGKPWNLNYVDALFFNKEQGGIWEDENGCYGTDLDKIRTDKLAHVSHWAPLLELPEELR